MRAKQFWEGKNYSYQEWANTPFDWSNFYKVKYTVESYLWRYDNYLKGLSNAHILKSTFGKSDLKSIQEEIEMWFNDSVGAYNTIEL